jgi:predicted nucleic acid-binding protein
MKVLIDTNIVLDLLLERESFVEAAIELFEQVEQGHLVGYIAATTVTNIFYIMRKTEGRAAAIAAIQRLLMGLKLCPVDQSIVAAALRIGLKDFEDGIQLACALQNRLDGIVTRDRKDFADASLPIYSTAEVLSQLTFNQADNIQESTESIIEPILQESFNQTQRLKVVYTFSKNLGSLAEAAAQAVYRKNIFTIQSSGPQYEPTPEGHAKYVLDISRCLRIITYCLVVGGTELIDEYFSDRGEFGRLFDLPPNWYVEALKCIKENHGLVEEAAKQANNYIDYAIYKIESN